MVSLLDLIRSWAERRRFPARLHEPSRRVRELPFGSEAPFQPFRGGACSEIPIGLARQVRRKLANRADLYGADRRIFYGQPRYGYVFFGSLNKAKPCRRSDAAYTNDSKMVQHGCVCFARAWAIRYCRQKHDPRTRRVEHRREPFALVPAWRNAFDRISCRSVQCDEPSPIQ